MILTKPKLLYMDGIDHDDALRRIERAAKNCYQSKPKDDIADVGKFVQGLVKRGHETPLEFVSVTVNLRTSRSVLAELTRHRTGIVFQVKSQRYCKETSRYGTTFVIPTHLSKSEPDLTDGYYEIAMVPIQGPAGQMGVGMQIATASLSEDEKLGLARQIKCSEATGMFLSALATAEQTYGALLQSGWSAQDAREILPNATATDIAICANLREWRHIFKLRVLGTTGKPYPPCREAVKLVYDKMLEVLPEVFGDLAELAPAEEEKKPEPPKKKSSILLGV